MAIVKWEPFGEFDRFFDDFGGRSVRSMSRNMAADLYEDGDNLIAEMSISGIDPEKVEVSIEGEYLRVSGTGEEEQEKKDKKFYSKEIYRGSFERTIYLPESVDEGAVEAECKDGLLKIMMPKKGNLKKEKIKVTVKK